MSVVSSDYEFVDNCLQRDLRIPVYQRPYCWSSKNIYQLLEDINTYRRSGKNIYRIGSVVLHAIQEESCIYYDIVDGQQRLTTIKLILEQAPDGVIVSSTNLKYDVENDTINEAKKTIESWIKDHLPYDDDKISFYKYLIGKSNVGCQFVVIAVDDVSEAFQLFDTQNGRGKELEAYNLLKAYHIRAMEQDPEYIKVKCDKRWENATCFRVPKYKGEETKIEEQDDVETKDILKYVFDETLYRSRIWSRREYAGRFSKQKIDEFKGFTIDKNHNVLFPFQNPQLLQYITAKFYDSVLSGTMGTISRFNDGDPDNMDPFVNINQTIVNGRAFFDYVETYVEIYKRIFLEQESYQLRKFKEFYKRYCENTYGRLGDKYLQDIYKSLIIMVFDRFGEIGVDKIYKSLLFVIYQYRLSKSQVKYEGLSKDNIILDTFSKIAHATDLLDLDSIQTTAKQLQVNMSLDKDKNVYKSLSNLIHLFEEEKLIKNK